jgi:hypothetical protein
MAPPLRTTPVARIRAPDDLAANQGDRHAFLFIVAHGGKVRAEHRSPEIGPVQEAMNDPDLSMAGGKPCAFEAAPLEGYTTQVRASQVRATEVALNEGCVLQIDLRGSTVLSVT